MWSNVLFGVGSRKWSRPIHFSMKGRKLHDVYDDISVSFRGTLAELSSLLLQRSRRRRLWRYSTGRNNTKCLHGNLHHHFSAINIEVTHTLDNWFHHSKLVMPVVQHMQRQIFSAWRTIDFRVLKLKATEDIQWIVTMIATMSSK